MPGIVQIGIIDHICPNTKSPATMVSQTESQVFVEGLPMAIVGDRCGACNAPVVTADNTNVCVGGLPVVSMQDQTSAGESFSMGSITVLIGG